MSRHRWKLRPDPASWASDELMSLEEAAQVFFPQGPLTVTSLRTAVRRGELAVTRISGKLLTTPTAVAAMRVCVARPVTLPERKRRKVAEPLTAPPPVRDGVQRIRELMRPRYPPPIPAGRHRSEF